MLETLIRGLRNQAETMGDLETARRHERRLQILVGMPASFTERRAPMLSVLASLNGKMVTIPRGCIVCHGAPCVCPELFEDDGADVDPESFDQSDTEEIGDRGREDF